MHIRKVNGISMQPTFYPGDIVIAFKRNAKQGDIVIVRVKGREVIKRVKTISPTSLFLVGDNSIASTDSRSYGDVPITSLLGVVKITFKKKRPQI